MVASKLNGYSSFLQSKYFKPGIPFSLLTDMEKYPGAFPSSPITFSWIFTYFSFKGVPNGTVQGCATACLTSPCFTAYPNWNLRGLTWEFSTNSDGSFDTWCYCSIDGYVADQNCTRVNAYGTKEGTLFKRDGTGPDIFSDGQGSDRCFAYRP